MERAFERAFAITFVFDLVLTAAVLGIATAIGIPEKWNGSLFLGCVAVGTIVFCELMAHQTNPPKRR